MEPIIVCENLSFSYETESPEESRRAIENVNLTVSKGELVAVLGRNGSGKSTLAKLLNGILVPDTGKVLVRGMDTADEKNLLPIRKTVGMVFQNPDNQLVSNVVEEDVAFGPENLGLAPVEIRRRVDVALKTVGMEEFRLHAPHKLSGGQKQRVAIAGVLAMLPECIVFDESTAMLDPQGRREILETVEKLRREEGIGAVLITHFMEEAIRADRVLVMEEGRIVREGTPAEIFSDVAFLQAEGLDVPPVTELLYYLSQDPALAGRFPFPKGILEEEAAANWIAERLKSNG